jgi:2C-methyl-D-erythritol 2,4-cyclodiphosphate synthase
MDPLSISIGVAGLLDILSHFEQTDSTIRNLDSEGEKTRDWLKLKQSDLNNIMITVRSGRYDV